MKDYTITVNGKAYAVTVEESAVSGVAVVPVAPAAPVALAALTPTSAAVPAPVAAPAGAVGSVSVSAPTPGKVVAAKTVVGQAVKKGDVILVLEAMKMENDIATPQDGTIVSINASIGGPVESGATLTTLN